MRSLFKLIRSFFYLITGRLDEVRAGVESNPTAMKSQYENIIKEKAKRANSFMDAVAGLMSSQEDKKVKHDLLLKEMENLGKIREGALSKAKSRANKLTADGKSQDEIKTDAEYIKHTSAYKDFSSTMHEKEQRAVELETSLTELDKQVGTYKSQLEGINREIDKLRDESLEAVADVAAATEQEKISKALSNISGDSTDGALNDLRNRRKQATNKAKVAGELSGTTAKAQEDEYLAAGVNTAASDELDSIIFGTKKETESSKPNERLPE